MNDNVIISYNGIEIYNTDIDRIIDQYKQDYNIPDEMLYKSNTFISLLSYIRQNMLKNIITKNHGINNNGYDYELLDSIFYSVFVPISGKYNHTISLLSFSQLTGISLDILTDLMSGQYATGTKANPENVRTVKKWYNTCKTATFSKAQDENSVGSIFAAKAAYNMRENDPQVVTQQIQQTQTPEQIAERYKDIKRPEIPELE